MHGGVHTIFPFMSQCLSIRELRYLGESFLMCKYLKIRQRQTFSRFTREGKPLKNLQEKAATMEVLGRGLTADQIVGKNSKYKYW